MTLRLISFGIVLLIFLAALASSNEGRPFLVDQTQGSR